MNQLVWVGHRHWYSSLSHKMDNFVYLNHLGLNPNVQLIAQINYIRFPMGEIQVFR